MRFRQSHRLSSPSATPAPPTNFPPRATSGIPNLDEVTTEGSGVSMNIDAGYIVTSVFWDGYLIVQLKPPPALGRISSYAIRQHTRCHLYRCSYHRNVNTQLSIFSILIKYRLYGILCVQCHAFLSRWERERKLLSCLVSAYIPSHAPSYHSTNGANAYRSVSFGTCS